MVPFPDEAVRAARSGADRRRGGLAAAPLAGAARARRPSSPSRGSLRGARRPRRGRSGDDRALRALQGRGGVHPVAQRVVDPWSRNMFSIPRGTGSGFVWDEDGHVVTNNHVILGASEARVRLNDGRDYAASLVGASPAHDLAVLRIRVPERPPAPLPIGTSARPQGRAEGVRHRQPVRPRLVAHHGHRLGAQSLAALARTAAASSRRSSRPTRRSIPAIRAGRCSTPRAG